jgi:transglutaminase-like putative cysteine protease
MIGNALFSNLRFGRSSVRGFLMLIRVGFEIAFTFPEPTSLVLMLSLHPSVDSKVRTSEHLTVEPSVPISSYWDIYGNRCSRVFVTPGHTTFFSDAIVEDDGKPDLLGWGAIQHKPQDLPNEVLLFLLASRYCEVDSEMREIAWSLFGQQPAGWSLVQAICNFVHSHIRFDYMQARATRTAFEAYREKTGVCRDYMHLAITFCRCLNIPARYCTGYLGDIGVPAAPFPMDFSAWFEVYLGGKWYPVDARNNTPRIGRILVARGRDAADVAITTTFGVSRLEAFHIRTSEVLTDGSKCVK